MITRSTVRKNQQNSLFLWSRYLPTSSSLSCHHRKRHYFLFLQGWKSESVKETDWVILTSVHLLAHWVRSEQDIYCLKTFTQTVYSGKDNEDYLVTWIRLYKNLKSKSSMAIPPDPDSVVQVIKRAHHQVYQ